MKFIELPNVACGSYEGAEPPYTVRNCLEKIPSRSGVHRAFWVQTVYIHVGQIPSIDKIIFENFRSRRFLFIVQMVSSQFLDGIYSLVCGPKPLRSSQTFVAATAAQNSSTINFPTRFSKQLIYFTFYCIVWNWFSD